jgi:hypothetical protein|tara:strand:+ start:826 stop:975 length:150 start_codon:yes stop_codon:yes gene_type:complete
LRREEVKMKDMATRNKKVKGMTDWKNQLFGYVLLAVVGVALGSIIGMGI